MAVLQVHPLLSGLILLIPLITDGFQKKPRLLPRFDSYRVVDSFAGLPAAIRTADSKLGKRYRTVLREGAKKGPNFAGHFTLVSWGCGSSCQMWGVIDARTGQVFDWIVQSMAGAEFYLNSRLLIIDSPKRVREAFGDSPGPSCAACGTPDAYEWVGTRWRPVSGAEKDRARRY